MLEDSIALATADAYGGGLAILTTAKTAMRLNEPNAKSIVEVLTSKLPQASVRRRAYGPAATSTVAAPPSPGAAQAGPAPAGA